MKLATRSFAVIAAASFLNLAPTLDEQNGALFRQIEANHKPSAEQMTNLKAIFKRSGVMSQGNPAKTTLTPAYLSYQYAFELFDWGIAAAMAFVLFAIILLFTGVQRFIMRDKDAIAERRITKRTKRERAQRGGDDPYVDQESIGIYQGTTRAGGAGGGTT